ncbi:MAG: SDR family oxidoreductase [Alphaproteobacteria bacterium]|nr:MAG: SDR family oxidoreductase [Alphaproteobacteria bacterium]
MDLGIRGKKGIVNGGSAGLGMGSARALAREGVDLVISARGEERLVRVCKEIAEETGSKITPVVADHSTEEGRKAILAECPEPDILVGTCSPPTFTGDYRDIEPDDWYKSLAITLISPVEFMRATVEGMAERGWGRVVNIGTVAAKYPAEIRILSGAPRAALANYTTAVSHRVARDGVIINNLLPGMYHTATVFDLFSDTAKEQGLTYEEVAKAQAKKMHIPSGDFGDVDDFGAFTALLCSEFARYTVGQNIVMDGGLTNSTF